MSINFMKTKSDVMFTNNLFFFFVYLEGDTFYFTNKNDLR